MKKTDLPGNRMNRMVFITSILFLFVIALNSATSQTYDGYTLYAQQGGTKAYLTDMSGNTYHSWTFSSSATTCYSSYLLPGGVLLRSVNKSGNSFSGGPISGQVQKVDWSGNILWNYVYSTTNYCSHHDIHPMPNGNVLLIAYERKTAAEVTQAGGASSIEMWPDKIVEIQPSGTSGGTVVWEWRVWDHLIQNYNPAKRP
ncbi:MAG: aryl-sulfate sulfotransferase [Bacteroidales bacterium]|nr:aryl-sulfate sulfotransferase [Bacteroidales bacterium]